MSAFGEPYNCPHDAISSFNRRYRNHNSKCREAREFVLAYWAAETAWPSNGGRKLRENMIVLDCIAAINS